MYEQYLVSIVIPIYNIEKYLKDCVDSIVQQTYSELEIILVDDGSTDNSGNICDYYAERDSRVKVIHKLNGGMSSSREAGINAASGEYIMMVDGDDWIDEYTVETCVNAMRDNGEVDCVMFSYVKEFPESSIPMHIMDCSIVLAPDEVEDKVYRRLFGLSDEELRHPERMDNIGTCNMKLYKSSVARKGKYFDTQIVGSSEDALFNMYALHDCGTIVYIDKCFYHYRKIDTSLTNAYRKDLDRKWAILFEKMRAVIEEKRLPNKYNNALTNRIAMSIIGIGMNEVGNKEATYLERFKKVRKYIRYKEYQLACQNLSLYNMPVIWRLFFWCCKMKMSFAVFIMLLAIMQLRKH